MDITVTGTLVNVIFEEFTHPEMSDLSCLTFVFDTNDHPFSPNIKFINLPLALGREIETIAKRHLRPLVPITKVPPLAPDIPF